MSSSMTWHDPEQPLLGSLQSPPPRGGGLQGTARTVVIVVGIVLLVGAWVAEGEITQNLQNPSSGNCSAHGASDPATGLCFPNPTAAEKNCSLSCVDKCGSGIGSRPWMITYAARVAWSSVLLLWGGWYLSTTISPTDIILAHPPGHYVLWLVVLGWVVAACAYTWFISLSGMPVSANTAVYNTTPIFVFIISIPALGERVTLKKVLATLFAVAGVAVVALDSNKPACGGESHFSAYLWCLLSVLFYALYEVGVKKYLQSPSETYPVANSLLLLGSLGVISVALFWPFFYILHGLPDTWALHEEMGMPSGPGTFTNRLPTALGPLWHVVAVTVVRCVW